MPNFFRKLLGEAVAIKILQIFQYNTNISIKLLTMISFQNNNNLKDTDLKNHLYQFNNRPITKSFMCKHQVLILLLSRFSNIQLFMSLWAVARQSSSVHEFCRQDWWVVITSFKETFLTQNYQTMSHLLHWQWFLSLFLPRKPISHTEMI